MAVKKTMSYSLMHLIVAFLVAYAVSRDIHIALGISLIEPIVQTFAYVLHERFWEKKTVKLSDAFHHAHGA